MKKREPLIQKKYEGEKFFIADIFSSIPFKSDVHTMEHPFFTLSTKKDLRTIKYEKENSRVIVSPSFEHGLPTVFDKDVLLYCGSLIMSEINKGNTPSKTIRISCHDLMESTNRESSGNGYRLLKKALDRLSSVHISTNIKTNGKEQSESFHIIDRWKIIESSRIKDRMVRLEIRLSNWYYQALLGHEVLTIHPDYFRLRKSSERRFYEIARKHCGNQKKWEISLDKLHKKSGSQSPERNFKVLVKKISETNKKNNYFPDYEIEICKNRDVVTFKNKKAKEEITKVIPLSVQDGNQRILSQIRSSSLEKAKDIIHKRGTEWCIHALLEQFCDFVRTKEAMGEKTETMNGAFIGFVKHKTQKAP